ncbi:MAG: DNA translocase FtsK [Clostridia bacterium]|nr:DNA translocase FtsK [Clostridia bacterium]
MRGRMAVNVGAGFVLLLLVGALVFVAGYDLSAGHAFGDTLKLVFDGGVYGFFCALAGYPFRHLDAGKAPGVIILLILIFADIALVAGPMIAEYLADTKDERAERAAVRRDARIAAKKAQIEKERIEREKRREQRQTRIANKPENKKPVPDGRGVEFRIPAPNNGTERKTGQKQPAGDRGKNGGGQPPAGGMPGCGKKPGTADKNGVFVEAPVPPADRGEIELPAFDPSGSAKAKEETGAATDAPREDEIPIILPEPDGIASSPEQAVPEGEEPKKKKLTDAEITGAAEEIGAEIGEEESEADKYANYVLPGFDLLNPPVRKSHKTNREELFSTGDKLISTLNSFGVDASVSAIVPGPSVTRYEVKPAPGVKISKFTNLADDIALRLAAPAGVRIEAPIPNKEAIGIEIPNRDRVTVTMREALDSDSFRDSKGLLTVALGKDIAGTVICADLSKMPHLLVAGTTGSGKSVCLNSMIMSILYRAKPDEIKLILIDPKQVEFSVYNGAPHLLVPVVSDAKKAAGALAWAVSEMLKRYRTLNNTGARDIEAYDRLCKRQPELEPMPRIVIVIDELSDLMSVAPAEVEGSITRLAQMARAAGMHLVVATQRPSVDVITGLIKANIPSRIALSVSSQIDSRTILDAGGAEKLLGHGDMLFAPVGQSKPTRVQGCFLTDSEVERIIEFIKSQTEAEYDDSVQAEVDSEAGRIGAGSKKTASPEDRESGELSAADAKILNDAALCVIDTPEKASISSLQRHLRLGFAKAGRIMDLLEENGVVGPHNGSKPRDVLMTRSQWYERQALKRDPEKQETGAEDD